MSAGDADSSGVSVELVYADAVRVQSLCLPWRAELTVEQALAEARVFVESIPHFPLCGIGVFGERVAPGYVLLPGDRIEIVPPLPQDPKESRRQRALDAKARERRQR